MSEVVKNGDAVLLHYTLIVKDEGKVYDTTVEEEAKKAGIYEEGRSYRPRLVIMGEGEIPSGLEEAILGMKEGEEKEIELPPEKAFGKRDPSKVRVIPARLLSAQGVIPRAGLEVEVRGERGIVISVGSGRAVVDFNHPLAGKTVVYKVKVVKVLRGVEERVQAFADKWFGPVEEVKVNVENNCVLVSLPFRMLHSARVLAAINGFANDVVEHVSEIRTVKLESVIAERESREEAEKSSEEEAEKEA